MRPSIERRKNRAIWLFTERRKERKQIARMMNISYSRVCELVASVKVVDGNTVNYRKVCPTCKHQ